MISLLLTLICVIAIIALLCVIAIPQLTASVKSIAALVQEKWPDWVGLLQRYGRHILLRSIGNLFCKAFRAK